MMNLDGEHIKQTMWFESGAFVVRVVVDAVVPRDDTSEPCFEPDAVKFLSEVQEHANAGDIEWLKTVGDVYVLTHSRSA